MFKVQKLDLLISIYIFCIAVSELMGAKTFPILALGSFHLNASVAVFVVPLIYTINDAITEVFGKDRARSMVRSGLVIVLLILLYSLLVTNLPSSTRFMKSEPAYEQVFGLTVRISAASLTAFAVAEFLDVFLFARLRKKFGTKNLWLRTNISNFVSQFVDTTLFMFLAFYALDHSITNNISFLASLIIPYWLLKSVMSIIETPFVYVAVKWLKHEKI